MSDLEEMGEASGSADQWSDSQLDQWQEVWDLTYEPATETSTDETEDDGFFDTVGWVSSYSGQRVPDVEMREWVGETVDRIRSLHPKRVLEIGCGTGLLLFRIAPECERYVGTDISANVVRRLQRRVASIDGLKDRVEVRNRPAHDLSGLDPESFDVIVLNSVVQYFPSVQYLVETLREAAPLLREGGCFFLGDLRSFPLMEAFHVSVERYKARASTSVAQLKARVRQKVAAEEELLIAPALVEALKAELPSIENVSVRLRRGRYRNEMTCFRYDVILETKRTPEVPVQEVPWEDVRQHGSTLDEWLAAQTTAGRVRVVDIPNTRVSADVRGSTLLNEVDENLTVGAFNRLCEEHDGGMDPEQIWALAERAGYEAEIAWARSGKADSVDVTFYPEGARAPEHGARRPSSGPEAETEAHAFDWRTFGNNPLLGRAKSAFVNTVRTTLKSRLPAYMVPSSIVVLDALPLTPNGKVDRRALPVLLSQGPAQTYEAPRSPLEHSLADTLAGLLERPRVGRTDDFFALGGHSLMAMQLVARLRRRLGVELSVRAVFDAPTVEALAAHIETLQASGP
ncbi:MAG: methyltransferase, partial [Bacteroidota bacterium]